MQSPENGNHDTALQRRSFLEYFGTLGLTSTLFPGTLWAQTADGENRVTADMVNAPAGMAGLEFTEEQRREMVDGVNENLESYQELRKIPLDASVAPTLYFNPAVAGMTFNEERRPFAMSAPPVIERPSNIEDVAFWPVTHLAHLIASGQVRSVELTGMYLDRLKRYDELLHCTVTLTEDLAMEQAVQADEEISMGRYRGSLHGIPWGRRTLSQKGVIQPRGARRLSGSRSSIRTPPSSRGWKKPERCSWPSSRPANWHAATGGSAGEQTTPGSPTRVRVARRRARVRLQRRVW